MMSKQADRPERRRKSAGFFPRASFSSLAPANDNAPADSTLKRRMRPASFFIPTSGPDNEAKGGRDEGDGQASPKTRPRTLVKNGRPTSIFGSLRSIHPMEEEEKLTSSRSNTPSIEEERMDQSSGPHNVLHHGEVQTTGGMFRKRKEYMVLTDRHLVRFKTFSRAAEAFPCIGSSLARSSTMRHTPTASTGTTQDLQSVHSHSSADNQLGVPLHQIIAVYMLEDGRPYFSIEVAHLDEEAGHEASINLQLNDPREADLWLSCIRVAANKARMLEPTPSPQRSIEYVARVLEQERDYDPARFQMFKVVQRAGGRSSGRASSDDLTKLNSTICYLVIGAHKVHLIPLRKSLGRTSSTSLSEMASRTVFGITTMTGVNLNPFDDGFELTFRFPLRKPHVVHLASCASSDVALWLRHSAEYLRPEWLERPFTFQAPPNLEDIELPIHADEEDHRCFDRTLIAYCAGYDVDTSNIRYAVNYHVEDAPEFALLPPASPRRSIYSVLELLAVLRALRYNESFHSISFRGISLDCLHQLKDYHGIEHIAWTSRSGIPLDIKGLGQKSLLIQELQALALKSKKLRRMDFSFCIKRKPQDDDCEVRDPGCEIAEALFPLCRRQLTNVDWIVLNGIELGESDLDYLVDAAVERACHLRALEISRCGLTDRSLQLILNAMLSQDNTLESIDISGNLACLSPATFQGQIGHFGFIRKLNLSRVHRTSGPEPLVSPETILTWRLEELHLSETAVNEQTIDSVSAYLASSMSDTLRELRLNQCGLTGGDVAVFMHSMTRRPGEARNLHLHVSENRLEKGHDQLVAAVENGLTPSHLTMRMVEYQKEDHFRDLVKALTKNTTLRYLDISKASLPYDASHETCEALQQMFTENRTLEELDISGEHAHLEVAKFGIGLNHALTGLKNNCALRVLRIEYQKLGLQGANTLSSVLEENTTLREIYCENNDINLQGFTVLVDGLSVNQSVLYLPRMDMDRRESLQKVEREIQAIQSSSPSSVKQNSVRRTLAAVRGAKTAASSSSSSTSGPAAQSTYTDQDVREALRLMNEKWDRQVARLEQFVLRNMAALNGGGPDSSSSFSSGGTRTAMATATGPGEEPENERPATATSITTMLQRAALSSTPTLEKGDILNEAMAGRFRINGSPASSPPPPKRVGKNGVTVAKEPGLGGPVYSKTWS